VDHTLLVHFYCMIPNSNQSRHHDSKIHMMLRKPQKNKMHDPSSDTKACTQTKHDPTKCECRVINWT